MTEDTITAIKKALEGVTPDRVERLWWFLHIMSQSSGTADASDDKWNWINAFCCDYEDDTFNLAKKLGFIRVTHDTDMDASYAAMTDAGNVLIAYFDKAPSATANTALESLQRENERFRQFLFPYADNTEISGISWDGKYLIGDKVSISEFREMQNRGLQIDVYKRAYDEKEAALKSRAEAAEAEVKRYREALHIISAGHACPIALANNALRPIALSSTGDTHDN